MLPDPLPDGANPFLVIDRMLLIAHCAALYLTHAREERMEQLGRMMRTEVQRGVRVLHWEDDVDRRPVDHQLCRLLNSWHQAHTDARKLCAGHGIPFGVCDPLLKTAWDTLEENWSIVRGVASDKKVYPNTELGRRLHDLAASTTPYSPTPDQHARGDGEKPTPKPKPNAPGRKGKDINARLLALYDAESETLNWSAQKLADRLGCAKSVVVKTSAWSSRGATAKALMRADVIDRRKLPRRR